MSEHNTIRDLLALAAADALSIEEQRRVEQHLAQCAACTAELDAWRGMAEGLKRLPTPQPSPNLVERVRVSLERRLAADAERRVNYRLMAFLVLFAWTVTLAGWPIARLLSQGLLGWIDPQFRSTWILLVGYTMITWVTGGIAGLAIALRHRSRRRFA